MFSLFYSIGLREALFREAAPFIVSLIIAQLYFKWGSFALELVGFLGLWLALGALANAVSGKLKK